MLVEVPPVIASTAPRQVPAERRSTRTCIGCGRRDAPGHLVRVVAREPGGIAVDMRGGAHGRGAHVHPTSSCVGKAAKRGLSRPLRRSVQVGADALARAIRSAGSDRVDTLLSRTFSSGTAVVERRALDEGLAAGRVELLVVAADSFVDDLGGEVAKAIAQGRAVVWGSCCSLGALAGFAALPVFGVRGRKVGAAIAQACRAVDGVRTGAEVR